MAGQRIKRFETQYFKVEQKNSALLLDNSSSFKVSPRAYQGWWNP